MDAARPARLPWRAARILEVREETPTVRTLVLDVPGWPEHRAGQHVDVRLTAEDGYQAQRSYSIASAPGARHLELTVERLEAAEVSPWLAGTARTGDRFEVRGPIGGWFVWLPSSRRPLVLIAGGSGIVPLMAMLRHREATRARAQPGAPDVPPARLLYSARSADEIIYRAEVDDLAVRDPSLSVAYALTRVRPPGWTGYDRRIDAATLRAFVPPPDAQALIYVCGPTPMVEAVAHALVELGHPPVAVRTERFGPTGRS